MAKSGFETYTSLRQLALRVRAADLGLTDLADASPFGMVMDMSVNSGFATLVCFLNGEASLYFSSGGGVIGAGQKVKAVHDIAKQVVAFAGQLVPFLSKTTASDLPAAGMIRFYVLTPAGTYFGEDWEADLQQRKTQLAELYAAGQSVITEFRPLLENPPAA
jgi:hypothetical protein